MLDNVPASEGCRQFFDLMFREAAGRNFDRFDCAFADGDETQQALDDLDVGYETAQSERKWSQGGVREGGERKAHFT